MALKFTKYARTRLLLDGIGKTTKHGIGRWMKLVFEVMVRVGASVNMGC